MFTGLERCVLLWAVKSLKAGGFFSPGEVKLSASALSMILWQGLYLCSLCHSSLETYPRNQGTLIEAAHAASDLLLFLISAKAHFQQVTVSVQSC